MTQFGKLKKVSLREIWKNEATEFTPWLAENIESLGDALGMDIELQETEAGVGDFSLDILAKDVGSNRSVIIENQLTATDHDHLGKLITYASGYDASVIVWLSEHIREEHRQALNWLNERTDAETEFFGVVVEVLKIDDSKPAYNFNPVVFPNEWRKEKKPSGSGVVTEKGEAYRKFFQSLIDELREKYKFTNARRGQPQNWYSFSSGYPWYSYGASFALADRVRSGLYIDSGTKEENKNFFDFLEKDKASIEREMGQTLQWERLENRRACRIAGYRSGSILQSESELQDIRKWMLNTLVSAKQVFEPRAALYENENGNT